MKPIFKFVLILVVLAFFAGAGVYWYAFMRPPQNMEKAKAEFKLSSSELFSDFSTDETKANSKYLGKIIEVSGTVVQVKEEENQTAIILENKLFGVSTYLSANFCKTNYKLVHSIKPDQSVTIRGQCDGLLSDVVISRAVIVQ